ncbi:hypothetical protein BJF93_08050 [Xaviernesmea oryzae]|uniref:Uncharacterized protein n=1 Tax=Xaviernesmea oryzae TaxID=464029 RepID=A0A1Q9B0P0_9HYPH|nr:hypothetical protein BJF93_08050 [Xaviernesmea oryzae]SEL08293.1 hypothetical protein SAMN04487976_105316 [Xaviernesmea oryzae]
MFASRGVAARPSFIATTSIILSTAGCLICIAIMTCWATSLSAYPFVVPIRADGERDQRLSPKILLPQSGVDRDGQVQTEQVQSHPPSRERQSCRMPLLAMACGVKNVVSFGGRECAHIPVVPGAVRVADGA